MTFEELQAMAQKSRRAGATLAKRANGTWHESNVTDALVVDANAVATLVASGSTDDTEALAQSLADVLWTLAVLADDLNVDLTAAFASRHQQVITDISRSLTALDAGEYLV